MKGIKSLLLFIILGSVCLNGQSIEQKARKYIESHFNKWGLTKADIATMSVTQEYLSPHNGVSHVYFKQKNQDLEVSNAIIGVHVAQNGEVIFATSNFIDSLSQKVKGINPLIAPQKALAKAFYDLNLPIDVEIQPSRTQRNNYVYPRSDRTNADVPVNLCFYPDRKTGEVYLAWKIDIDEAENPDIWNYYIDARTGQLLSKNNYALHCTFPENNISVSEDDCVEEQQKIVTYNNTTAHQPIVDGSRFNVFPIPVESPIHGNRSIIENPADPFASPFGWQDTNGIPGVDLTITRGNNVHAFLDIAGDNQSDNDEPDGGISLNFDFSFDIEREPSSNKDAAVTQLYYMNNIMHDFSFHYGFDEAAGNFQLYNYSNRGLGEDHVLAQAQDGANINNATFATLPDGKNGRMQMHLWDVGGIGLVEITEPGEIAERIQSSPANFGPAIGQTPIEGQLVQAQDNSSAPSLLCDPAVNTDELEGKIALIDRGSCFFKTKVKHAEEAGAIGAIICNVEDRTFVMGDTDDEENPAIPSVMIKRSDCQRIKLFLETGVKVKLQIPVLDGPTELDAAFDNGIVAHEYAHGISNRLTGGPLEVECLFNDEQMGEGWSDFFALVISTHPDIHLPEERRGIGNYVIRAEADGPGIRRLPYSNDFTVNDQTYDDIITTTTAPHPVGEVWAAILWDLYWAMIDEYGWDDNIYTGNGGNNMAIQLVMDGMKLQKCNPGFVDGRDAILAADRINYGGNNECLIWRVFARRGLGWEADQGTSFDRRDGVPSFETKPACLGEIILEKKVTELIEAGDLIEVRLAIYNYRKEAVGNLRITDNIPLGTNLLSNSINTNYGHGASSLETDIFNDQIVFNVGQPLAFGDSLIFSYQLTSAKDQGSKRLFFDGAERGFGQMSVDSIEGDGRWIIENFEPFDRQRHWYIATTTENSDQALQNKEPILIDGEQPILRFYHKYITEPNFDGGIIEVSPDGINWEIVDKDKFFKNPYRGTITYSTFTLPDAQAFWGNGGNYRDSYVDLSDYKGQEVFFRFRFGNLAQTRSDTGIGWIIDNIEVIDMFNYATEACVRFGNGMVSCTLPPNRGTVVQPIETVLTSTNENLEEEMSISIYPNPVIGQYLTAEIQSAHKIEAQFSLLSAEGKVIDNKMVWPDANSLERCFFDVQNLSQGVYFLRIKTNKGVTSQKVIIN